MKKNIRMLAVMAVLAMLLTLVPLQSLAAGTMTVTGDFVNLRDSYKGGGKVLACLRKNTVVTLVESKTYNGGWYHVKAAGQEGYIWGQYLKAASSTAAADKKTDTSKKTDTGKKTDTKKTDTAAASKTSANGAVRRNNDTVRATVTRQISVRATANGGAKVVGTLKTRTTVSVLSRRNNYVYITTSRMSGYVPADSVMLSNTRAQTAKVKKVQNGNYKIYVGSTGSGKTVGTVKQNSTITVLHQGSTWSYVKVGNVYGYVAKNIYTVSN